jgi:hypothetical protein
MKSFEYSIHIFPMEIAPKDGTPIVALAQYAFRGVPGNLLNQYLTEPMSSVGELPLAPWNP